MADSSQRKETIAALRRAGVKYSRLIMNPGSSADTAKFKYEVGIKLKGSVNLAIDNNATMRAAYSKAGIKTIRNLIKASEKFNFNKKNNIQVNTDIFDSSILENIDNLDNKNIIKDFLNYIIRNHKHQITVDYLKFIENILHNEDINDVYFTVYSLVKLSNILV